VRGLFPSDLLEGAGVQIGRLVVREAGVSCWGPFRGEGLFLAKGLIAKGEVVGVYGGTVTKGGGPYVLEISGGGKKMVRIDGTPDGTWRTLMGKINEDIHHRVVNVRIGKNGIIKATRAIREGEELLTSYGLDYDWDMVKDHARQGLRAWLEDNGVEGSLLKWLERPVKELRLGRDKIQAVAVGVLDGIQGVHQFDAAEVDEEGPVRLIVLLLGLQASGMFALGNWGKGATVAKEACHERSNNGSRCRTRVLERNSSLKNRVQEIAQASKLVKGMLLPVEGDQRASRGGGDRNVSPRISSDGLRARARLLG